MTSNDPHVLARALLDARNAGANTEHLAFRLAKGDFPSMADFLTDPEWAGEFPTWPGIRKLLTEIASPDIREFHAELGKGSGKSSCAWLILGYSAAELLAMDDPHAFFGLGSGKPIVILNVSVNETQARRTVFAGLRSFVEGCPHLKRRAKVGATHIEFDGGKVLAVCGHSKSEGLEGYDVYAAVLDEANKHADNAGRSNAQVLFEMLRSSAATRFPKHYRVGTISSSVSHDSYQRQVIEEIRTRGQELPWST